MADNPYDPLSSEIVSEPDRTSALAVVSLVLSVICCIPGLGLLGVLTGIGALVGIKSSGGRVGGTGLAIAGIVVGGLVTVGQVGIGLGFREGVGLYVNNMLPQIGSVLEDIEAGDDAAAIAKLAAPADTGVTPEHVTRFRDAYLAEFGSYVGVPTNVSDLFGAFGAVGEQMQGYSGGSAEEFPAVAMFDSGPVLVLVRMNPDAAAAAGPNNVTIPITNLILVTPSGSTIALWDPTLSGTPGGAGATTPDVPGVPATPADAGDTDVPDPEDDGP